MLIDNQPYTLDRIARIVLKALLLAGIIYLLNFLRDVLVPFAAAFLLAFLLNPLVNRLQRRIRRRGVAIGIALLLVLIALMMIMFLLIPVMAAEFAAMKPLARNFAALTPPAWFQNLTRNIPWQESWQRLVSANFQQLFESDGFRAAAQGIAQRILPGAWNVITGAFSIVLGIFGLAVVFLYTVFLLMDYNRIREHWEEYLPAAWRTPAMAFVHDFNDAMSRYFRGQALIAAIVGGLFALGFWLIGLPLAIFLGLCIGLLNMVPYLQIIGMIPAFALALLYGAAVDGNLWRLPLLLLGVLAVVQGFQDLVLTPRIMGRATGLSPALILLSLAVWGKLLGLLGLLIAIPMTCLVLAYYRRVITDSTPAPDMPESPSVFRSQESGYVPASDADIR